MNSKYIDISTLAFGVLTLVFAAIVSLHLPQGVPLPDGFQNAVIAFEFAESESDISFLQGNSPDAISNRLKMAEGHYWDTFFPIAYGLFLFFILYRYSHRGVKWVRFGMPIALICIPLDLMENSTLMSMIEILDKDQSISSDLFHSLHIRTWLKWGAIGISILLIGISALKEKEYWTGGLGVLTAVVMAATYLSGSLPQLTEIVGLMVGLFFLWNFIKMILFYIRALR